MRLYLPREHGAWAMLAAPPLIGMAAASGGTPETLLFWGSLLGAFLLRTPAEALLRRRGDRGPLLAAAVYGSVSLACLLILLLVFTRWGLLVLAVPGVAAMIFHIWLELHSRSRLVYNKILAIAALSLGAPAVMYAGTGIWGPEAGILWLLICLYLTGPVFYVKMAATRRQEAVRTAYIYHLLAAVGVTASALFRIVPVLAVVPFVLAAAKTLYWRRGADPLNLKKIGWTEVLHTLLFVGFLAAGYA